MAYRKRIRVPRFTVALLVVVLAAMARADLVPGPLPVAAADAGPGAPAPDAGAPGEAAADPDALETEVPAFVATDDLKGVKKRGLLRVLVEEREPTFLARGGATQDRDRELVREFARRQGVKLQFVPVADFGGLIPALAAGKGDVIASGLTVTDAREALVAFTTPVATVSEILVGRKGAANPKSVKELGGREVHVRAASAYAETLQRVQRDDAPGLKIVSSPTGEEPEALAWDVSRGTRPLTVVDSHVLAGVETYNDQLERCFSLADGRQIAWAVRRKSVELKAALDAYLIERAMTAHGEERETGDLSALKVRGSLRVLTRNNPVTYFLHRGERLGFDYELAGMAAAQAGLRLEMIVVPSRDLLVPWLLEGRGDVIAASFTDTAEREKQVAFSKAYLYVDEVLVQRTAKSAPHARGLEELKGRKIAVRKSSSYWQTLAPLQAKYGFSLLAVDEEMETEEVLDALAHGQYDFTVADGHILDVERAWRADIEQAFVLPLPAGEAPASPEGARAIAFAVRPTNPELKEFLDGFVRKAYRGVQYNMARRRYFEDKRTIAIGRTESATPGQLSPYDELIRKLAQQYELDWRLMAAQAYQESHFDPRAKSWVGAKGLFQVMPTTGKSMGFIDLEDPEQGAHAGIEYMHRLIDQLDDRIPFKHRVRFALAAYNVGLGHVLDAQRLAQEQGLNPRKWFGHVEKAMLLLEKPKFHAKARHGYCRGSEPVKYVSEIQNRYDNYVKVIPE